MLQAFLRVQVDTMFQGRRLHERRKQLGLSQDALGKRSGVSQGTIAVWETGSSDPSVSALEIVAIALGVPVQYFLDGKSKDGTDIKGKKDDSGTASFFP